MQSRQAVAGLEAAANAATEGAHAIEEAGVTDVAGAIEAAGAAAGETKVKTISIRTAHRWLVRLGWVYSQNRKGYVAGHEREDE